MYESIDRGVVTAGTKAISNPDADAIKDQVSNAGARLGGEITGNTSKSKFNRKSRKPFGKF